MHESKGYFLEVDIEDFPEELHDWFNDLPLAPETIAPRDVGSTSSSGAKLICHFKAKKNYVIYYKNLEYYLSKGMKISKIHRVMEFTEEAFMKPYIDFNTAQRKNAKNDFEKDFWKLMSNAVFGKSMENVRNRQNIRLCSKPNLFQRAINKPTFKKRTIFSEDLVALHMNKIKVQFYKPIYIGLAVLELSKLHMYQFYYDVLKEHYGSKLKLLYMDTDSFILEVTFENEDGYNKDNFHNFMKKNPDHFDTSDYRKNHEL